jgi:hypothetical protein
VFEALRLASLLDVPLPLSVFAAVLLEEELRTRRAMPMPAMTSRSVTTAVMPATMTGLVDFEGGGVGVADGGGGVCLSLVDCGARGGTVICGGCCLCVGEACGLKSAATVGGIFSSAEILSVACGSKL